MGQEAVITYCELCDSKKGIRREDNIYVCNECNEKFPIKEKDERT